MHSRVLNAILGQLLKVKCNVHGRVTAITIPATSSVQAPTIMKDRLDELRSLRTPWFSGSRGSYSPLPDMTLIRALKLLLFISYFEQGFIYTNPKKKLTKKTERQIISVKLSIQMVPTKEPIKIIFKTLPVVLKTFFGLLTSRPTCTLMISADKIDNDQD